MENIQVQGYQHQLDQIELASISKKHLELQVINKYVKVAPEQCQQVNT